MLVSLYGWLAGCQGGPAKIQIENYFQFNKQCVCELDNVVPESKSLILKMSFFFHPYSPPALLPLNVGSLTCVSLFLIGL